MCLLCILLLVRHMPPSALGWRDSQSLCIQQHLPAASRGSAHCLLCLLLHSAEQADNCYGSNSIHHMQRVPHLKAAVISELL
jgi:hypothetical protein